ncbi:MAG: Monofunctional biosynthetic peptidoglycan transglycosylase [uncultured Sphingomonadaceae bacterium]|uniref:Biosynthetic peptidoglycan transglycosylase n=1 Tax=uncultured Sphingomonadaceae bacterium TaxID=169976 RepID=A0A6J4T8E9_9SPHN|nr:MAG: Monofunctional biosynthetic peptidoglycan transglycosylase [uncultured Sphingomonadaceae bacterium]
MATRTRAAAKPRPAKAKPSRGLLSRLLRWVGAGVVVFTLGSFLWVALYRVVPPPLTFTQVADLIDGRRLSRDWMSIDAMDPDMARAAIAGEDARFCRHSGFDAEAIAGAAINNLKGGRIRGGSTISQQTAKNAFLWQNGGYARKALEAWFTVLIELIWPKRRIMEMYLNVAETGIGTYGANAGAQRYFQHDASRLTRTEAARIAAVLPQPKKRAATAPKGFTRRYGNSIAARMRVVERDGLDACVR